MTTGVPVHERQHLLAAGERHDRRYGPAVAALKSRMLTAASNELEATLSFLGSDSHLAFVTEPYRLRLKRLLLDRIQSGLALCHLAPPLALEPPPGHPSVLVVCAALDCEPRSSRTSLYLFDRAIVGSEGIGSSGELKQASRQTSNQSLSMREQTALTSMLTSAVLNASLARSIDRSPCDTDPPTGRAAHAVLKNLLVEAIGASAKSAQGHSIPRQTARMEQHLLAARSLLSRLPATERGPVLTLVRTLAAIPPSSADSLERVITAWRSTTGMGETFHDAFGALILERFSTHAPPEPEKGS